MNICLVSSSTAEVDFPLVDELADLGLRVVVLFLEPQSRHLWNQKNVVYFAPASHFGGKGSVPLETRYRQILERARARWLIPLKRQTGNPGRILLGLERRGYRIARAGGSRIAGRLEAVIAVAEAKLKHRAIDPLENLPLGVKSYGVFHALDAQSTDVARIASTKSGALLFSPETADAKAAYEQAIMHWLRV